MFTGEFTHSIDAKGRVTMPSKFRENLGEIFYVTKSLEKCLVVYPMPQWKKLEDELKKLPVTTNKEVGAFVRFITSGASETEIDKQGRVMIPQNLRTYASLTKDAVVIGMLDKIEIWDQDEWNTYTSKENMSPEAIAEKMESLNLGF